MRVTPLQSSYPAADNELACRDWIRFDKTLGKAPYLSSAADEVLR